MGFDRSSLIVFIGGVIAFVVQLIFVHALSIASAMPNILLAYALAIAVVRPTRDATLVAFVCGLLFNLVAGGPVGSMALLLVVAAFIVSRLVAFLGSESLVTTIIVLVLTCLVLEVLYALILVGFGLDVSLGAALTQRILPCTLYDCVACLIIFALASRFIGRATPKNPLDSGTLL